MARGNGTFLGLCCLLAFVLMCHELVGSAEGRHLRDVAILEGRSSSEGNKGFNGDVDRPSKVEQLEGFRPTNPGHSPGVGHSIKN
ncbi:hypothetical protein CDL15_Pgr023364 [Punica granatum]|uniref:Uncharacterized protein n=1 Tax=Punica granatum TaxID=22663 RepID=A0A218Y2G7_PUNGR|nr:hypothetical protein CDL15_Pgr023364 [Punica granatum]PKI54632.1 hypothetical protein CRG98_024983 [Punica granatum]